MMKHKKVYMKCLNIGPEDIVLCEVCGAVAVDVHHVLFKSLGGVDLFGNLIALCRYCHDVSHGKIKDESLTRNQLTEIIEKRTFLKEGKIGVIK